MCLRQSRDSVASVCSLEISTHLGIPKLLNAISRLPRLPNCKEHIHIIQSPQHHIKMLLTLGTHAPEGSGSCPVCVSVCLSATLIWGLGLVEV